jgi:Tol biopolymer transport system component
LNGPSWAASAKGLLLVRHNQSAGSQLTWFTRDGRSVGTVGDPGNIASARISPDQKTIAYSKNQIVWLHDIARNLATRLVSEQSFRPIWSLDGRSIIYDTARDGKRLAVERPINAVDGERILFQGKASNAGGVLSLSPDGRWIAMLDSPRIFFVSGLEGKTVPFLENAGGVASISPDGRWVLYTAISAGRQEIFVQSVPEEAGGSPDGKGARFQISTEGGSQPHWRSDGKEIFYLKEDMRMISVPVESGERLFRPGIPKVLFETRLSSSGAWRQYDVTPDGQRFLIPQPVEGNGDKLITAIVNWPKLLQK